MQTVLETNGNKLTMYVLFCYAGSNSKEKINCQKHSTCVIKSNYLSRHFNFMNWIILMGFWE